MSSWRDAILNDFVPHVSKLTLVADPDGLLTEEKLSLNLQQRGFDLIEFNDPVEFRYAYESKYRSIWDQGETTDLVVVLRTQDSDLATLPYDLLQAGRKLSFDLGELFPNMSYPVIEKLDRSLLDALFDAQCNWPPDRMGDNATMDFILRHVFGIAAELIATEVDLLRALLRLHYGKTLIPQLLADRLVQVFCGSGDFKEWPLDEIISDGDAFFAFLQERWPIFLGKLEKAGKVKEMSPEYGLRYSGPDLLPFDHQDIRIYIDNLFIEGKLSPVDVSDVKVEPESWFRIGIKASDVSDESRTSRLFEIIENNLPTGESRYSDWTSFALKWAELTALVHCEGNTSFQMRHKAIGDALNATFSEWLTGHYASLINLPPTNPAMLHHVPRYIAREMECLKNGKAAIVVVDGLALDQWVSVRKHIQKQNPAFAIRESATFAWIPTLTSISRQSIFSGKPPLYYPSSIKSTNSEEKLWKQFWESYGFSRLDVAYQRGLGDGDASSGLDAKIHPGKTKVVGLVVDKVDKIMHGMQLGASGMHNQIRQWCDGGFLFSMISYLLDNNYNVWMTSDHGNIECQGNGRPMEGAIAETRGERVRVYPTPELRSQVAISFPTSIEWNPVGLPTGHFPLFADGRDAFVGPGESIVSHGGISIEEVIVPLVKFERNSR